MASTKDEGHARTDRTIEEIEKLLEKEYSQASQEVTDKWNEYWQRHAAKDSIQQQMVADGKITLEEYKNWKHGQLCIGQRWKDLKDQLAQDLVNVDAKARSITQGYMPDVYALNHNYATFQVEKDSMVNTSYTLYNRRAVENMIRDDRSLLPYPRKDSPTAKMLMQRRDLEWNRQHIHSAITQGILQGESNPQIAKRLQNVVGMDKKAAIRNARTMMTGVENKARQDAYDDLKEKGIDLREKWMSTLDGRTRASHRWMHGEFKDPTTGEYPNGLRYPADPNGEPEEVYNCRCCEIAEVMGHSIDAPKYSPKMKDMSFDDWQKAKGNKESLWWFNQNEASPMNMPAYEDVYSLLGEEKAEKLSRYLDEMYFSGRYYEKYGDVMDLYEAIRKGEVIPSNEITLLLNNQTIPLEETMRSLKNSHVMPVKVNKVDGKIPTREIIQKISGGDKTEGSCASLSLCYAGNRAGYDCRDFRDGESRKWFSSKTNKREMYREMGINVQSSKYKTNKAASLDLLSRMQDGKEYILEAGMHSSVVRRTGDTWEYLELQSSWMNGWKGMGSDKASVGRTLANRWGGMYETYSEGYRPILIEVDDLVANKDFPQVLEYINTKEGFENKGSGGHER